MPRKAKRTAIGWRKVQGSNNGANRVFSELNAYHAALTSSRRELDAKLAAVSGALAALGGSASRPMRAKKSSPGTARRAAPAAGNKPFRKGSLKEHIVGVLTSSASPLRVVDVTQRVTRNGYRSKGKNLPNQVSTALAELHRKRLVKKVARGTFTVG